MPQVSIIIPIWRHERILARCLESLVQQTYKNFEVIVVDDGNMPPLRGEFRILNFEFRIVRQAHAGAAVARNRGAREAQGEFLLFVDADSQFQPDCLKIMVKTLELHAEVSYAYSSFKWGWKKFRAIPFDSIILRQHNIAHTTSLIRVRDFPGFDESLTKFQDWDLWLTMLERGKMGVAILETLFEINPRGGTMSKWAPSFWYHIPWQPLRHLWPGVSRYEEDRARIITKHPMFRAKL